MVARGATTWPFRRDRRVRAYHRWLASVQLEYTPPTYGARAVGTPTLDRPRSADDQRKVDDVPDGESTFELVQVAGLLGYDIFHVFTRCAL